MYRIMKDVIGNYLIYRGNMYVGFVQYKGRTYVVTPRDALFEKYHTGKPI